MVFWLLMKKQKMYYIAGYISKWLSKQACSECSKLLSHGKVPMNVSFDNIDQNADKPLIQAKEEFIKAVSGTGLTKPSDYIYITTVHVSALYKYIFNREDLKKSLFTTENSRDTFVDSFLNIISNGKNSSQLK